ncbi:M28 family peptidase [Candidatus Bathyarchaeota archaeon]|nr:M28 family peptidase [Candidatus Bathyarchaeota archaeon]
MQSILEEVDQHRLYRHILELEGPNDPVFTPGNLDAAADYISEELKRYGLDVNEQRFTVDGKQYRNVEGVIDTGDGPELLLTAHYDTIPKAPGADDNLSAVSVMLEAARVLSKVEEPLNFRVIGFTLEEGPPEIWRRYMAAAQELGLRDERFSFTSLSTRRLQKKCSEHLSQGRRTGRKYRDSMETFMDEHRDQMTESELQYFGGLAEYYREITLDNWIGEYCLVGSSRWVKERLSDVDIAGVMNLDGVGYTSDKPHSQSYPPGFSPEMFKTHLVDDLYVGNYIPAVGDSRSGALLDLFMASCRMKEVYLPYACLQVPMSYEVINEKMFDILRSDHAPFWREGIPAIFLTDTGNFRYPYYHTRADTIDKLDFEFIAKVCKASVATAMGSSSLS